MPSTVQSLPTLLPTLSSPLVLSPSELVLRAAQSVRVRSWAHSGLGSTFYWMLSKDLAGHSVSCVWQLYHADALCDAF